MWKLFHTGVARNFV